MKFLDKIEETIKKVETSKAPLIYFILTFFFAATLRNFLEIFSSNAPMKFDAFSHYYLSYACLALGLIILFHYITKEKIVKISRVILPSFLILILVPIIDLIISFGRGHTITYMLPGKHDDLGFRFLTFFGPFNGAGITPGMRIEIGLIISCSFLYFFIKKRSIIRSLFSSFLTYSLIFTYCAMPFVLKAFLNLFGLTYNFSSLLMRSFYLLLILILGAWLFYLHNKKYFIEILKDIRPFRLLHYELMFVLGIILVGSIQLTPTTLFNWIFIMASIVFAWLFSVITNNLADIDIDKITNKKRPSVSKSIPVEYYKQLSWIFLLLAIVYSWAVDFTSLFLMLLFIGNYFLYSMPPFRLKRVPFFSKLFIAINSLVLLALGYTSVSGGPSISAGIIFLFLAGLTALINFIDIKDYEGDKKAGIRTLPVILGLKKSKLVIGSFFLILHTVLYFILGNVDLLLPLITIGAIQFCLINRRSYSEKPVFIVYLFSLIMLIIYLARAV